MKRLWLIILLLLIIGCSKPIDDSLLVDKGGLMYLPDSDRTYTGKAFKNYKAGNKEYEGTYKNGKVDGLLTMWYEGGQKKAEQYFKGDKLNGLSTYWYENGQKKEEGIGNDGKLDGLWTWWYENGQKKEEKIYNDGILIDEKNWNTDGNVE
tara:strand:- start:219 stop:671 length:453 start_codon:yes stop_codon:yes gene_type:complete